MPVRFDRQLDILMAAAAALLAFVSCIFVMGVSIKISLIVTICVLVGGLVLGRRVAEIVSSLLG